MAQTMEFKTEVSKLLDIVIHSLYSNKDIFLRELISNASDAIDKVRYEGLTDQSKYENDTNWKIKLTPNKSAGTLTISDNGIGMDYDEVINTLGTIANSGTKEFMKMLEEKNAKDAVELIGQFGVGFYSAFMVADKVTVITRKAGQEKGVKWESEAAGTFEIGGAMRGRLIVTTPTEPVLSPLPKNPPLFLRNSRKSRRRRQHMLRTSLGCISLLM